MRPMLATAAIDGLPGDGASWAYEVKWDGMRVLTDLRDGRARVFSRTERDVTVTFPELQPLARAHPDVLLDGEVVVLEGGLPSFAALAERMHVSDPRKAAAAAERWPATLIVFDALRLHGVPLLDRPWQARREALTRLTSSGTAWQVSPEHDDRDALVAATIEQGLEGVMAKRRTSTYRPGVRSRDWLKLAHRRHQTCVVAGWRPEAGSTRRLGALLLGIWREPVDGGAPQLSFAGRVGSGLAGTAQAELLAALAPLRRQTPPFAEPVPRLDSAGAVWVQPQVVVEVRHLGHTEGGRLRQPVYRGLRADVDPTTVREE